jgi:hypothetical protein
MKQFQIMCGGVRGIAFGRNAGVAFRKLIRTSKTSKDDAVFPPLARFREVRVAPHSKRIVALTPWFYQEPLALQRSGR